MRGATVLTLAGRLCSDTVRTMEPVMTRLLADDPTVLVIDLAGVRVCDQAGLAMLDACHRASAAAGVELRLAAPSEPVRRAMRDRRPTPRPPVFDDLDAATGGARKGARQVGPENTAPPPMPRRPMSERPR